MHRGLSVKDAVMEACKRIATTSVHDPKRRRADGRTTFNVSFYALNKEGKFFGGCDLPRRQDGRARRRLGASCAMRAALRKMIIRLVQQAACKGSRKPTVPEL